MNKARRIEEQIIGTPARRDSMTILAASDRSRQSLSAESENAGVAMQTDKNANIDFITTSRHGVTPT